jgi:uncharacterized protein (TIGR00255 family)
VNANRNVVLPGRGGFKLAAQHEYACVLAPREVYGALPPQLRWGDFEDIRLTDLQAIRERFARRMTELAPDAPGLEDRIFLEAASLATKADVREELDRLAAHVASARTLLQQPPAGRKLDFLMQEFMREANTLCSKSATTALTGIGLELKAVIEQLREQVQNVE